MNLNYAFLFLLINPTLVVLNEPIVPPAPPAIIATTTQPTSTPPAIIPGDLLRQKAILYATQYGVDPVAYTTMVQCENITWNPTRQSDLRYKFSDPRREIVIGDRERSYGLVMIHQPDHPDIPLASSTDPDFSLDWGAKEISEGRAWQWGTCARKAGLLE